MKLIAENMTDDLSSMPNYESVVGNKGEIRLYYDQNLTEEQLNDLQYQLTSQGVKLTSDVRQESGIVVIPFEKVEGISALPVLVIIAGIAALVGGSLLGWQIFQSTQFGVPLWVWGVGALGLIVLFFSSDTGKQATSTGLNVAKMYVTKGALK